MSVDRFIPTIGATGFYRLSPPFVIPVGERYTCKAIRKISEHRSLGTDVFKDIYQPNGITEDIFNTDNEEDAEIISLMADGGRWIHVPSRFILGYPDMNGVPYRGVALHISLPPFPVDKDFSHTVQAIKDNVQATLGVISQAQIVETTRTSLVPSAQHAVISANRQTLSQGSTSFAQAAYWKRAYDDLLLRYNALAETYTTTP